MSDISFGDGTTEDVGQVLSAAALRPPGVPVLEALLLDDEHGARDVVLNVVLQKIIAVFVAHAAGPKGVAVLVTADLKNSVGVTGLVSGTDELLGVEAALVLHHADVAADEGARHPGPNQRLGRVALAQDSAGGENAAVQQHEK